MAKSTQKRRNKGEGSIAVMANGKLRMTITIGRGIDGKQKRKVVTASTRQELLDKAAEVRLKYKVGNYKELLNTNITFIEYAKQWLDKKSFSASFNTSKSYEYVIRHFKYIYDMQLNKITTEDINNLLLSFKDVSTTTIKYYRALLNSIFSMALDEELILKNPVRGAVRPTKRKNGNRLVIPTEEEVKRMLELAKDGEHKKWKNKTLRQILYPFLLLAVTTGMRRGELSALKWENIDFKTNKIKITHQMTYEGITSVLKTETSYRTISVAPEVLELLKQYQDGNKFVFGCSTNSSPAFFLRRTSALTKEIFRKMELDESLTLHSLRHFHATQLIKHGINIKVVSKRLGHSNIQTTLDIYVHWLPSMDEEASLILGKNYVLN